MTIGAPLPNPAYPGTFRRDGTDDWPEFDFEASADDS